MADKFIWNLQYSVHLKEIDEQHKRFFELINAIYDLVDVQKVDPEKLLIVLTHLGDYAFYHFATEEGYFKIFHYDNADIHTQEHDMFRAKAKEFLERARRLNEEDPHPLIVEMADFAKDWLARHILIEDKKYMPLFRTKGLQ
ncbi:MAG: bacteriohemerythrin [Candidatus Peribacter sp.]|nr:bacteriohemerythrin [Candidatus Peribacter sp.]